MGIRIDQLSPRLLKMIEPGIHPPFEQDHHPAPKNDKLEREEQRQFATWCLLKNYPFCWHSTASRTKATPGVPDFIIGVNRITLWIEFKRPGYGLSEDQEKFAALLAGVGIQLYVVYSAHEAIALTNQYDRKGVTVKLTL
jgi:hypothetical protein